ncbi:bifunctional heptose 7-phosphate kinase/heptose 1-phosphate adenyltransferase [Chlamydiota bacterium]
MINKIKGKKVLVVGDLMLDVYTMGNVERISPEAPVPVLRVSHESRRPGGAGNAILNLVSLGMKVVAVGRVGNDFGGRTFLEEMAKEEVDTRGILCDPTFQTPLKNRMIAAGQQIVRIDYEQPTPLQAEFEQEIAGALPELLEGVQIVAISDYAKGFLTQPLLRTIIQTAKGLAIPVIVDPKGLDFTRYYGATVIKPNLSEAISAAGLGREATLDDIASRIVRDTGVETLMVTRSREGISVFSRNSSRQDFPAQVHEIKDVTGAGDTVLAVVTAALANRLTLAESAQLANIAAGIAIERVGCARISLADLASRLLEIRA